MCKSLCTYRKYIRNNSTGYFDCSENPHIILGGKSVQSGNNFSTISPFGAAQTNLYSTTFHYVYFEIYNQWVNWINSGSILSGNYLIQPNTSTLTIPGTYDGYTNPAGVAQTFPTQQTQQYQNYNMSINTILGGTFGSYAQPPFEFANNIAANEYVPAYNYNDADLDLNPYDGNLSFILVEFLDVNGSHCKGA